MPSAPVRTRRRPLGALLALTLALAGATVLLTPTAAFADAADRSHDPFGHVATVRMDPGGLRMVGWAADPDSIKSNLDYVALVDGKAVSDGPVTPYTYPSAQKEHNLGPTPGFRIITPVPTSGKHSFCLAARNIDVGIAKILKCVALPLGRTLSADQVALHSPVGQFTDASAGNGELRVQGWADDPDFVSRYSVIVLYVDGRSVATRYTHVNHDRADGAGYRSAIDITVPVSKGTHVACLWAVNGGIGHNAFIGCRTRDTRGPANSGSTSTPALNQQVVTEAIKHRGQDYVWGASGPKTFDCSGLVAYSYKKFGYTTPRVSSDQRVAARLIGASRAVPGDLVFYHDHTGDVYHVGIYVSPGKTVAAIDTQEGVDWQYIWDPKTTTYGSFTHS